jgi:hypothetical protein
MTDWDGGNYDGCGQIDSAGNSEDDAIDLLEAPGYDTAEYVVPRGHPDEHMHTCNLFETARHKAAFERSVQMDKLIRELELHITELHDVRIYPLLGERDNLYDEEDVVIANKNTERLAEIYKRIKEIDQEELDIICEKNVALHEMEPYKTNLINSLKDPQYDANTDAVLQKKLAEARAFMKECAKARREKAQFEKARKLIEKLHSEYGVNITRNKIMPMLDKA